MSALSPQQSPEYDIHVPTCLKPLKAWVDWRYEQHGDPNKKPRKTPYYPKTRSKRFGEQNRPEDIEQLTDFSTALEGLRSGQFHGVGLALREEFEITALDFDDCVNNGIVDPDVLLLVRHTYAEFSPSGNGIRAFVRGILTDKKSYKDDRNPFGFETFSRKGFVTITGTRLDHCKNGEFDKDFGEITPEIQELYNERFGEVRRQLPDNSAKALERGLVLKDIDNETVQIVRSAAMSLPEIYYEDYDKWIDVGEALKSLEQANYSQEANEIWHNFSKQSNKYDFSETNKKWGTFNPSKITYKSVLKWAADNGWANPKSAAAKISSDDDGDYATLEDRTDTGNANMLRRLTNGDLRFVPERCLWISWDGSRWLPDPNNVDATNAAHKVSKFYHQKALELKRKANQNSLTEDESRRILKSSKSVDDWANYCRSKRGLDNMLALAQRDARIILEAGKLDNDPWLFGTANGVVDLRTGELSPDARDQFVTKRSPFAFYPQSKAPRWLRFIEEITALPRDVENDTVTGEVITSSVGKYISRPALANYLKKCFGYFLTGSTREHKMFILIGGGANGKSELTDNVQEVTGDYCKSIPAEALMATRYEADAERPSSTLASLAGARLAFSSESRDGQRLDVQLVKRHTGDGFMTARFMRENTFRFPVTHKLVLLTNHKPSLDHMDTAVRGRLHLIPFDRAWNRPGETERNKYLPDGDKELKSALRAEGEGILAWLVEGAREYYSDGLEPPEAVSAMTREYLAAQDPVSQWLDSEMERCNPDEGETAQKLLDKFKAWQSKASWSGTAPGSIQTFANALLARNVCRKVKSNGKYYGLKVKPKNEQGLNSNDCDDFV